MQHRLIAVVVSALALFASACDNDPRGLDPNGPFLEVHPLEKTIDEGETLQLTATLGDQPATVTWESSDTDVGTVDANGLLTTFTDGYTAVTASLTSNPAQKASASITVNKLEGTPLTSGVSVTASDDGEQDHITLYRIRVPDGTTNLTVTLTGGTGDADIYVRHGAPATLDTDTDDAWSFEAGNNEMVSIDNPADGTWYIAVALWEPYSATLTATLTP